ncbi:MAG: oligosaccharide flippase family protein [Prevotellaceae bacterium]|jgi:O-antigen/teichoic acid export membrane protein|nr:oligosaccharide flippase family protein [Prevotellaceae bacterium]
MSKTLKSKNSDGGLSGLAKDTTIYGVSSILARALNFLLLPVYTRKLDAGDFGIYSELFSIIAVLQVILAFGMETGFFRFASREDRDPDKVFSTVSCFLLLSSLAFFIATVVFSGMIAEACGYYSSAVIYAGVILAADAYTSVFFARLRYERKAKMFAVLRTVKIFGEIGFNLLFIFLLPLWFERNPQSILLRFFTPQVSYLYIIAAVACSCILSVLMFLPTILRTRLRIHAGYLAQLFFYSFPLMLAGLQGILGEMTDRLLFRFLAPETAMSWSEQLGLFSANARLAVIMSLFVQMFRYAAEPFFFSSSSKGDVKAMYADAMKYFTCFCVIVFLFISFYSDLFQYLLGRDFREGISILPIMLMAYLLSGVNQNLSMWYKLASQTSMALVITLAGLATTVIINLVFMPRYGYMAAAWGHPASYLVMIILSWNLSKSRYKIPYRWASIVTYILAGVVLFFIGEIIETPILSLNIIIKTFILILFLIFVVRREKINVRGISERIFSYIRR